jgi:hypothetical protein
VEFPGPLKTHIDQALQRRIGFRAGPNLREEYSAGSQEWKNEASDFRQGRHRPCRSEIERGGHFRIVLNNLLRPPKHQVDAGQRQQAYDVTKKRNLLPRDLYQREIEAWSYYGDWDGGKTGPRSEVQGPPRA